jgi:NADH-quinone oxidoreductase subunit E
MLTAREKREIEAELKHYQDPRAACVDAMKIVQRHRGWVSNEALQDLAPLLSLSLEELDGVATFYNLIFRRPVGKHVIMVCDSVSCWLTGYERVRDHLVARLGIRWGETTADGRFTLLPIVCLGACERAPAMMVDDNLHADLSLEGIDAVLEGYERGDREDPRAED